MQYVLLSRTTAGMKIDVARACVCVCVCVCVSTRGQHQPSEPQDLLALSV